MSVYKKFSKGKKEDLVDRNTNFVLLVIKEKLNCQWWI